MSALSFDHVTFAYAGAEKPVLLDACLEVPEGAFALLVGATGSGKSTLLRLAKPEVAPVGELSGAVRAFGADVRGLDAAGSARAVGYVFQSPDAQMVCDTVWHELAFGLENLGVPEAELRRRVAETATYLGMGPWFRERVAELSGGRRQVLALASVLAMRPRALLLDEPTSMLDPVTEQAFLALLFRANRELGMTVVVATHTPEAMADYATCAFALEGGRVREVALEDLAAPRNSAADLTAFSAEIGPKSGKNFGGVSLRAEKDVRSALSLDDVWFRYDRDAGVGAFARPRSCGWRPACCAPSAGGRETRARRTRRSCRRTPRPCSRARRSATSSWSGRRPPGATARRTLRRRSRGWVSQAVPSGTPTTSPVASSSCSPWRSCCS